MPLIRIDALDNNNGQHPDTYINTNHIVLIQPTGTGLTRIVLCEGQQTFNSRSGYDNFVQYTEESPAQLIQRIRHVEASARMGGA